MSILVKIDENFDFRPNFRKMSTWVETYQVVDYGQNWKKMAILVKVLNRLLFLSKFSKISIWSKLLKNLGFGQNY